MVLLLRGSGTPAGPVEEGSDTSDPALNKEGEARHCEVAHAVYRRYAHTHARPRDRTGAST